MDGQLTAWRKMKLNRRKLFWCSQYKTRRCRPATTRQRDCVEAAQRSTVGRPRQPVLPGTGWRAWTLAGRRMQDRRAAGSGCDSTRLARWRRRADGVEGLGAMGARVVGSARLRPRPRAGQAAADYITLLHLPHPRPRPGPFLRNRFPRARSGHANHPSAYPRRPWPLCCRAGEASAPIPSFRAWKPPKPPSRRSPTTASAGGAVAAPSSSVVARAAM